jgi:inhibitor of cysteine peptidase
MKTLFCLFALALAAAGCATSRTVVLLEAPKTPVEVSTGDHVVIRIRENPTTGYTWQFAVSPTNVLEMVGDTFERPQEKRGLCGAPGMRVVTYAVRASGPATISGSSRRPWEKDKEPVSTVSYSIHSR